MHSRPTMSELLDAVRQHLTEQLIPTLNDPQLRFRTLVAAHVLAVVERELALGERPLWQEWAVLTALLHVRPPEPASVAELAASLSDLNRQLATQIRAGERDDDPNVLLFLKQQVAGKLEVSNPQFRRGD